MISNRPTTKHRSRIITITNGITLKRTLSQNSSVHLLSLTPVTKETREIKPGLLTKITSQQRQRTKQMTSGAISVLIRLLQADRIITPTLTIIQ